MVGSGERKVLSDLDLRKIRGGETDIDPGTYADAGATGLYIQVGPPLLAAGDGPKRPPRAISWTLRTVVRGKRREMGLGSYPTVSLKEARDKARWLRDVARKGGNPLAERDRAAAEKDIPTFETAARQ